LANEGIADASRPDHGRRPPFQYLRPGIVSGPSYFAQGPDGHGRILSKQYAKANRARLNGDEGFIKVAQQSAIAGAALPKS
jgi:hypothetical protein